ncbi:MAG: hypothetical protein NTW12_13365 [Deltaproteobacteria bacterium]|nr:hypothetical protein [Deltaproteobacteria bacterium]
MPESPTSATSASLTVGGKDVVAYKYKLDSGIYSLSWISIATPISLSSLSEGSHTVSVIGKDSAGNWQAEGSATMVTWTVDLTPSTATISGTPAALTNATSVSLTVSGTDVVAYKYKLDGGVYSASEIPAGTPITLSSLSEGSHTVSVIGKDTAGNWQAEGSATTVTWTVDINPPTGTISINNGALRTRSTSVILNITATDTTSGVVKMSLSSDGVVYGEWEHFSPTRSWILSLAPGEKRVYVKFKDAAGNESVPYSGMITLDATEKGDIDGSGGVVDLKDVILALQVMSRITPAVPIYKEADVNGDGRIGLPEAIYILQKVGEIR